MAVRVREGQGGRWEVLEARLDEAGPASIGPAEPEAWSLGWGEFLRRGGIRGEVLLCLPEEWVTLRGVQVPEVAEAAQDDVNRFEAIQALSPPIGEWVWDCEGCGVADGKVEVLVASASLQAVDTLVQQIEDAGCETRRVLPPSAALYAGVADAASAGRVVVVAGEADLTLVVAAERRRVVRTRRHRSSVGKAASAGGTAPAAVAGGIPEKLMRLRTVQTGPVAELEAPRAVGVRGRAGGDPTLDQVAAGGLDAEDLGWLQLELARALARCRGAVPRSELLLAGEALATAPAMEAVGVRLRLPVRAVTPVDVGLEVPPGLCGAATVRLAGALRLAAGLRSRVEGMCLLPGPRRRSLAWRRRQAVVAGFAAAAALTLLPPTAVQAWRTDEARRRAAEGEERVRRMAELAEANRRLAGRIVEAESARRRADALLAERSRWTGLLADLQSGVEAVDGAWLESVQLVRDPGGRRDGGEASYRVIGHILDGSGSSESRLRTLLGAVVRSPWVARLEHERFQRRDDGRLRFEVQLAMAGEPRGGEDRP